MPAWLKLALTIVANVFLGAAPRADAEMERDQPPVELKEKQTSPGNPPVKSTPPHRAYPRSIVRPTVRRLSLRCR